MIGPARLLSSPADWIAPIRPTTRTGRNGSVRSAARLLPSILLVIGGISVGIAQEASPDLAATLGAEPSADSSADSIGQYALAPGDRIALTVFDQPDLSGEFTVEGTGRIMLPLIGDVPAAGSTAEELQARIAALLADGYLQMPVVNVRVAEFRPIYVTGGVNAPGSFPFRYGSTVLSAVALAGGLTIGPDEEGALRGELLAADERLRVLQLAYQTTIARRIRLTAQRDRLDAPDFSVILNESSERSLTDFVAGELSLFTSQVEALEREIGLLQEQIPRLNARADALDEQARNEKMQIDLLETQIDSFESLVASGLARTASVVELQVEQSKSRSLMAGYMADAAEARLTINEVELRIQESEAAYTRRILTELQDAELKLMELEVTLPLAQEARDRTLRLLGAAAGDQTGGPVIVIKRMGGDQGIETIVADEGTMLMPGDIIQVERRGPDDAGAAMLGPVLQVGVAGGIATD